MESQKENQGMTGAELASMLKGQLGSKMQFPGLLGQDDPSLHLSEAQKKWWQDAKLGLFIHWGVYSVIGKGEWAYFNEKIPEQQYREIAENKFKPKKSAEGIVKEWLDLAQQAGMKYSVMVTRHHDGFAMWDSKHSWKNFTSASCGPKTDYVKAYMEACHNREMYAGIYYSPMDWRFPGYFDPKGKPESAAMMKEQAYRQIEELCTQYGKADILWYDGGWLAHEGTDADAAWFWEPLKLNQMVRSYQPDIMLSPRSGYRGDFECDEGAHEVTGKIVPVLWEKCMSVAQTWGYKPNDTVQSGENLIRMLVNTVCRGGNLLLNIGPDSEGVVPQSVKDSLAILGDWMRENGDTIYGTRAGFWQPQDGVFGCTYKDNEVYVHILDCERFQKTVLLETQIPEGKKLIGAQLQSGDQVEIVPKENGFSLSIPQRIIEENRLDTIITLSFEEK